MKKLRKYLPLFTIGGGLYFLLEIMYRGYSHWSMFMLGGSCFICIGLLNEWLPRTTPVWIQALIGGGIITILEFVTGYIVNILLGWKIWDYSNLPLNVLGQICLPFCILWIGIAAIAILLDDWLKYWIFHEKKPKHVFF